MRITKYAIATFMMFAFAHSAEAGYVQYGYPSSTTTPIILDYSAPYTNYAQSLRQPLPAGISGSPGTFGFRTDAANTSLLSCSIFDHTTLTSSATGYITSNGGLDHLCDMSNVAFTYNPTHTYSFTLNATGATIVNIYGDVTTPLSNLTGLTNGGGSATLTMKVLSFGFDAEGIPVSLTIVSPEYGSTAQTLDQVRVAVNYGDSTANQWLFTLYVGTTTGEYYESVDQYYYGYPNTIAFRPSSYLSDWTSGIRYVKVTMYESVGTSSEVFSEVASSTEVGFFLRGYATTTGSSTVDLWDSIDSSTLDSFTREGFEASPVYTGACGDLAATSTSILHDIYTGILCAGYDVFSLVFLPERGSVTELTSTFRDKLNNSFPFSIFYGLNTELYYVANSASSSATTTFNGLVPASLDPAPLASTSPAYALEQIHQATPAIITKFYEIDQFFATNDFWNGAFKNTFEIIIQFFFALYILRRTFRLVGFRIGADYWETYEDTAIESTYQGGYQNASGGVTWGPKRFKRIGTTKLKHQRLW